MIKNKVITAGGKEYQIQAFMGIQGLAFLNKLKTIVGPSLALVMGGEDEDESISNPMAVATDALIGAMDKYDVQAMIMEIIENCVHDKAGQPLVFDIEFSANYGALLVIIKEVLTLNYGTIFLEIAGSGSPLKALTNQ